MGEFNPQPYSFVLSKEFADSTFCWELMRYNVESPTFAVLLDHTIAVIWHVFNISGAELSCFNKADLTWALRFLEAIDTAGIGDTTDLDTLKNYFRKILITRYSVENEKDVQDLNKTMYDSISDDMSNSSGALQDFLSSQQVIEDMEKEVKIPKAKPITKCTDEDLLQKLKSINPNINSINDLKNFIAQQ
jgi:hypothetical protein